MEIAIKVVYFFPNQKIRNVIAFQQVMTWITRWKKYPKGTFSELTTGTNLRGRLLVESTKILGFLLLYENTANFLVGIINVLTAYTYSAIDLVSAGSE